jgi:hypothetical protein
MATPTVPNVPFTPPGHNPDAEPTPSALRIIVFGVLVAVFGAVAIFVVVKVLHPPAPAFTAGDCVEVVDGGQAAAEIAEVDCGSDTALYEVGVYLDDPDADCPGGDYAHHRQTGGKQQEYKLCMVLNVADGDCLSVPETSAGQEEKVACTSDDANVQVTEVVAGVADRSACPAGSAEHARVYPEPKRTVCLGRAPA